MSRRRFGLTTVCDRAISAHMDSQIPPAIVLTGPAAAGKSTLARFMQERTGAEWVSTSRLLRRQLGREHAARADLVQAGGDLDEATDGHWLVDALPRDRLVIVDCVRDRRQLAAIRAHRHVRLVHVVADEATLRARLAQRDEESAPHVGPTRPWPGSSVVDTTDMPEGAMRERAVWEVLRLLHVDALVGGQYGSEGKGNVVADLAPSYDLLVRSGGPNAGHTVHHDGRRIVWKLLPSGALHMPPDGAVALGPATVIGLELLLHEIERLPDSMTVHVDPRCILLEDDDAQREQSIGERIGSTSQGVGAAVQRKIARTGAYLARDQRALAPYIENIDDVLLRAAGRGDRVLLEGTQGSGLSLHHGPYPHVTSRDTNISGLASEIGVVPGAIARRFLVVRSHPIRVAGPSGPLPTECTWEDVAKTAGVSADELRERERTSTTKRLRRVGYFDWALFGRAVRLNDPTDLVLTFADYIDPAAREAWLWSDLPDAVLAFCRQLEQAADVPVTRVAVGPDRVVYRKE